MHTAIERGLVTQSFKDRFPWATTLLIAQTAAIGKQTRNNVWAVTRKNATREFGKGWVRVRRIRNILDCAQSTASINGKLDNVCDEVTNKVSL